MDMDWIGPSICWWDEISNSDIRRRVMEGIREALTFESCHREVAVRIGLGELAYFIPGVRNIGVLSVPYSWKWLGHNARVTVIELE